MVHRLGGHHRRRRLREVGVKRVAEGRPRLDPGIAEISPATADLSVLDFVGGTEMLDTTFTVTATGTRLDKPVFILTGQVQNQGFSSESTYEIAADYAMLAEKSASDLDGQPIEATMDVTEWDVKQDIVAPL